MFVFHFYINSVNISCIGNRNTVGIFIYYIPTAFLSIRRNMTILYVLENTLMKVSYIIVIRLVPLPENFVADNFIPSRLINGLIKNRLIGSIMFLLNLFKSKDSSFSPYFSIVAFTWSVKSCSVIKLKFHIINSPMLLVFFCRYQVQDLPGRHYQPACIESLHCRKIANHRGNSDNERSLLW